MAKSRFFSNETKVLINDALNFALELGDDHISTIHFFIAGCKKVNYNPREFLFPNEDQFQKFYNSRRIGNPKKRDPKKLLSLTKEAEETIRASLQLKKKIKSIKVEPIQLLLAALKVPESSFLSICEDKENAYSRLYDFYKNKGYIIETEKKSFMERIKRLIFKSSIDKSFNNSILKKR